MKCDTMRKGQECPQMSIRGCGYNGGRCYNTAEACNGCQRQTTTDEGVFCIVAPEPANKWRMGACNFATHLERKRVEETQKINPLKASKRAAAAKKK
jgi:hypothetical protein